MSALVSFQERIQQRDQVCGIETAFIKNKVSVGEHTGELRVWNLFFCFLIKHFLMGLKIL